MILIILEEYNVCDANNAEQMTPTLSFPPTHTSPQTSSTAAAALSSPPLHHHHHRHHRRHYHGTLSRPHPQQVVRPLPPRRRRQPPRPSPHRGPTPHHPTWPRGDPRGG